MRIIEGMWVQYLEVRVKDRVAQLVLEKIATVGVEEVKELYQTERGKGSYGSTSLKKAMINNIDTVEKQEA